MKKRKSVPNTANEDSVGDKNSIGSLEFEKSLDLNDDETKM